MIFADYPGHFKFILFLTLAAGLIYAAFRSGQLEAKLRWYFRLLLAGLKYDAFFILLLILLNPSRMETVNEFSRNAVLVFFDTSQSMSVADDAKTSRLDKALKIFGEKLNPANPEGPEFKIYGFDEKVYHSGSVTPIPGKLGDWEPNIQYLGRWGSGTNMHNVCDILNKYNYDKSGAGDTETSLKSSNVKGAVIFTDGRADDTSISSYTQFTAKDFPLVIVGVGDREHKPDLKIKSIEAPVRIFVDTAYKVEVTISADNLTDKPITVELLKDGLLMDARIIAGEELIKQESDNDYEKTVEFVAGADTLGSHSLLARVSDLENEINRTNNAAGAIVEVVEADKINVLFYSQVANFNIGKLRQVLAREPTVKLNFGFDVVKTTRQSAQISKNMDYAKFPRNMDEFNEYDIIVLGDCCLDQLSEVQVDGLYNFVTQRGGGLIILPGKAEYSPDVWKNPKARLLLPVIFNWDKSRLWPPKPGAIESTPEGVTLNIINSYDIKNRDFDVSAFYTIAKVKPASTTLAYCGAVPIIALHRIGRGRVCLLNISQLFLLYRENLQGGPLYKIISGMVSYMGHSSGRGIPVELFAERSADEANKIKFSAYVCNSDFVLLENANVLLNFEDKLISMLPAGKGLYTARVSSTRSDAVVATVQAESEGVFLGEKLIAVNLPVVKNEMTDTNFDETFLKSLAKRFNGRYIHADQIDDSVVNIFKSQTQTGSVRRLISIWPKWSLFIILCSILCIEWLLRRAKGLI
jgi:hypothetical protein